MSVELKSFNTTEDIIYGRQKIKIFPMWSDLPSDANTTQEAVLYSFYTSSTEVQTASLHPESYYNYNIYETNVNSGTVNVFNAEPQFSITFGSRDPILVTSSLDSSLTYTYPSNAVYRQLVNKLIDTSNSSTYFTAPSSSDALPGITTTAGSMKYVFAVSVARSRVKDSIEWGSWQLNLNGVTGSSVTAPMPLTASKYILNLVSATSAISTDYYDIVGGYLSGSYPVAIGTGSAASSGVAFGKFYPKKGVFVLDADKVLAYTTSSFAGVPATVDTILGAGDGYIPATILNAFYAMINSVGNPTGSGNTAHFQARSVEKVQSTHYFVRVKYFEFNSTNNPTAYDQTTKQLKTVFVNDPRTFVTSVGLYDASSVMMAVAKTSKPLPKTPDSELLIKVRLDFVWFIGFIPLAYHIFNTIFA